MRFKEGRGQEAGGRREQLVGASEPLLIEEHQITDFGEGLKPNWARQAEESFPDLLTLNDNLTFCPLPSALFLQGRSPIN